eukprot:CAMPEP_0194559104 /NCGR_PEP_ID=MMETSP0292-20121207/771_1 /TAXON_ID=39354 /ORGANISM="Heterosigma akashiwo, Strain CCMP2393" /LENGTH=324 /DNA_ID=CAMNT_0039406923 /DNA_START=193 /DNA_END=1164 /DNA_ORIENTATION=-
MMLDAKGSQKPQTFVTKQETIDVYIVSRKEAPRGYEATLSPPGDGATVVKHLPGQKVEYIFPSSIAEFRDKVQRERSAAQAKVRTRCLAEFMAKLVPSSAKKATVKQDRNSLKRKAEFKPIFDQTTRAATAAAENDPPPSIPAKPFVLRDKPCKEGLAMWRSRVLDPEAGPPPSLAEAAALLFGEVPNEEETSTPGTHPRLPPPCLDPVSGRALPRPPGPEEFGGFFWQDEVFPEGGKAKALTRKMSGGNLAEIAAQAGGGGNGSKQPPEDIWVACDKCAKWRRLPADTDPDALPARWFCRMNPDRRRADCAVGEEVYADKAEP